MKRVITIICTLAAIVLLIWAASTPAKAEPLLPKGHDAMIDYMCMQDCQARGYMYQYCQRVCSY